MDPTQTLARQRPLTPAGLSSRADWIRLKTIELIEVAGSGHYASTFSSAEIIALLYYRTLRLRPREPSWPDRDRFLLGKGHVAVGLYPCLADLGFFPSEWLEQYTRLGSPLGDHPDMTRIPGVDFSSGSIGHNLSVGVGMALGARLQDRDHRVFVLLGDGELNEGQVWEAAMSASHFRLGNLVAIVDANGTSLDGTVQEVMGIEPISEKWESFGWMAQQVDGHDATELIECFDSLPDPTNNKPSVVIARTIKGKGVSFMESDPGWHLGYLAPADRDRAATEVSARMQ